jgi:hypothetical protein
MRIVALDGTVLLDGEPITAAEPKGWANLDEKAPGLATKFTEKLTARARKRGVQLWVAGDKAYNSAHYNCAI